LGKKLDALPPYFRWDRRVNQWRAPGCCLSPFLEWLGERKAAFVYHSPRPAGFLPAQVPKERLPALRPYQDEALSAWTAASRRGLVALPTGSGKTRVGVRAILSLGLPALVVAPTRQLIHQWAERIREFYPGPVGLHGDGEHSVQPITLATYESAHRHLDQLGDHFDLLVVDEAHHLAAERLAEIAQMATARYRLGLSATFFERGIHERKLASLLGPLCFALPIARLAGKYLATHELKIIPLKLTPDEEAAYEQQRTKFLLHFLPFLETYPEAGWADFVRAASRSPGGREALAAFRKSREILALPRAKLCALDQLLDFHREDRTLVFTANNRCAYEISRLFLIPALTCDTERVERETILRRFREGSYRAIVSAKVLNEGLDVPDASVAIVAGGSGSPLEHAQRIGRVLRPLPGKKALVYELVVSLTTDWRTSERRSRAGVFSGASPL
jgi:superfamily II DNA or RNA helicase